MLCLFGRKRVSGQRKKTESEAPTFEIKLRAKSLLTCASTKLYKEYGLLFVQFFLWDPNDHLGFYGKQASLFGRIETLSTIFQHPVSENISGVSIDELLSKSQILCAKRKVLLIYRPMFTLFLSLCNTISSVSPEVKTNAQKRSIFHLTAHEVLDSQWKKRYFWLVPEPLVQQLKKNVGALGTRMVGGLVGDFLVPIVVAFKIR